MKLLTLNVHAWLEANQAEKIEILAETIVEKGYDIIALQEVNQLMSAPAISPTLKQDNYGVILLNQSTRCTKIFVFLEQFAYWLR